MSNGKLYFGKINVKKIVKDKLFKGEKGTYLDLTIWINDEPDNYGNHMSIQQSTEKDADKIYLGNGKAYEHKEPEQAAAPTQPQEGDDNIDSLPF